MEIGTQFKIFMDLYAKRAIPESVNNYRITLGNLKKTPDNKTVTVINAIYEDESKDGFEANIDREIGSYAVTKTGYVFYGPCVQNDTENRDEVTINKDYLSGKLVELVSVENGINKFIKVDLNYEFNKNNALSFEEYLEGKFQEMYELTHKDVTRN